MSFSGILKKFIAAYKGISKGMKTMIFICAGLVAVIAIAITLLLNSGQYTVLYRGLSATESYEIYALLEKMSVDAKIDEDGSLLVPTDSAAQLKMQLAAEGYPNGTPDYDLFLDQSDLMTSDYEQRKLYVFQLQNRLQESIATIQGVKSVIVTLGIPEDNSYVLKGEEVAITASVVLQLYSNTTLTTKQISGIELLVTKSVPGLLTENVVIVDGNGEQLNGGSETGAVESGTKMTIINQINGIFEDKIRQFLEPVFGVNGMSISVSIKVDFSQVTSEEVIYTPVIGDNGIISWVERSSDSVNAGAGTTDEDGVTVYAGLDSSGGDASVSQGYSAEYLVNQLVRQIQDSGGNITDMTIAVIVNRGELGDEEREKYRELVAYSAGVTTDKVVLTNAPFLTASETPEPGNPDDAEGLFTLKLGREEIIVISGAGVVFLALIITASLFWRKRAKKKARIAAEKAAMNEIARKAEMAAKKEQMPGEIVLNETREQALKRQIKDFSKENAETVAQLLRVWIKEEDNK